MIDSKLSPNIKQAVPFFRVANMEHSIDFYVEKLGFEMKITWKPRGKVEWCWLERGGAALMLQEYMNAPFPDENPGQGISIWFICEDALLLFHEFLNKGLQPINPFVGNQMWVTSLKDPDGYSLNFESYTEVPEGTNYSDLLK